MIFFTVPITQKILHGMRRYIVKLKYEMIPDNSLHKVCLESSCTVTVA